MVIYIDATQALKTRRSKLEVFRCGEVQNWVLTRLIFLFIEEQFASQEKNKCFETSFQHTSGWKWIPWLSLFPVLTSCSTFFIFSLLHWISHWLLTLLSNILISLWYYLYETSPTGHPVPSLSLLVLSLPSSEQIVTFSWLLLSMTTFAPVFYLLCALPAQHRTSLSQLKFES